MANTICLFLNNYQTTLGAVLSSTGTTITVSSTTGLPASLATGQFIPMTLTPASSPGSVYEIVYVTGISGANLTVTRGEENTSALTWNTGDILYSTNTAETTQPVQGAGNFTTVTASGLITANGGISVPNATTAQNPVTLQQSITGGTSGYNNVTSARALNTVYQNTTSRPLVVAVIGNIVANSNFEFLVGPTNPPERASLFFMFNASTNAELLGANGIVPPGWYYEAVPNNTGSELSEWYEY